VDALLMGILRADPGLAGVDVGTRIPYEMPLPYVMARRSAGSSVHPRFLDAALVDVQVWARSETQAEALSQTARDVLFLASRSPQVVVPGIGYISSFEESSAPAELPSDTADEDTYRYQGSYWLRVRPLI
jgi:hypothetical protein